MPFLRSKNLLFIHIPKTGGSTIEKCLGVYPRDVSDHDFFISGGPDQLQHLTYSEIKNKIGLELMKKSILFSIVRNPYNRFISEYIWRRSFDHPIVRNRTLLEFANFVNFKIFNGDDNQKVRIDKHFITQNNFLRTDEIDRSPIIFKFEDGFEKIFDFLEDNGVPVLDRTLHINKNRYEKEINDILNIQVKEIIRRIYRDDFITFDYEE